VKAISGVHTVRFKNELERNITIKLGYANAKVTSLFFSPPSYKELLTDLDVSLVHLYRSTNVKTNHVRDLEVTRVIVQIKKIIHLVKFPVVVVP